MSLKPEGSFKIRIRKIKTKDRNGNCLKFEYKGHIKIQNPQHNYLKIRNPIEKIANIRGPKNL